MLLAITPYDPLIKMQPRFTFKNPIGPCGHAFLTKEHVNSIPMADASRQRQCSTSVKSSKTGWGGTVKKHKENRWHKIWRQSLKTKES